MFLCGLTEHPSQYNAEQIDRGEIIEHPSHCIAERDTMISPRGEMSQLRSAFGSEGCPVILPRNTDKNLQPNTTQ